MVKAQYNTRDSSVKGKMEEFVQYRPDDIRASNLAPDAVRILTEFYSPYLKQPSALVDALRGQGYKTTQAMLKGILDWEQDGKKWTKKPDAKVGVWKRPRKATVVALQWAAREYLGRTEGGHPTIALKGSADKGGQELMWLRLILERGKKGDLAAVRKVLWRLYSGIIERGEASGSSGEGNTISGSGA